MAHGCIAKISNEEFVIIGGFDGTSLTARMVKFNTRNRTWYENQNALVQGRSYHGCTFINGNVIVSGGIDGNLDDLDSTEIINVQTGKSRIVGRMSEQRVGLALVTAGNRVLAIGGYTGFGVGYRGFDGNYLSSVEEFNIEEETWSKTPFSMNEAAAYLKFAIN